MRPVLAFAVLCLGAGLAGCSTNPVTDREQIVALPVVQAHADIGYTLSSKAQRFSAPGACDHACRGQLRAFEAQVKRLGAQLEAAARNMSPELFERIPSFDIGVDQSLGTATGSSAGGRVVLGSGIAQLEPADDVTAFLLAREMGHVIARHDEEDSGARIVFSAVTALLPVTLIARFIASALGSNALMQTWAEQQRREADEIALALLVRTGRSVASVAHSLANGLKRDRLPESDWAVRYHESAGRVALVAQAAPQLADFDNWLLHQSVQSIERVQACMKAGSETRSEAEIQARRRECTGGSS
jgi:Zn-dependent protease with chaperone function